MIGNTQIVIKCDECGFDLKVSYLEADHYGLITFNVESCNSCMKAAVEEAAENEKEKWESELNDRDAAAKKDIEEAYKEGFADGNAANKETP